MQFTTIASPVILGTASLIAFISVRSTSIADRIRGANREIVDATTVPERRDNLLRQVHGLRRRYFADTYAMLFLLIAFAAFVALGVASALSPRAADALFGIAAASAAAGFALTVYEVVTAKDTLLIDIAYAEKVANAEQRPNLPTGSAPETKADNRPPE